MKKRLISALLAFLLVLSVSGAALALVPEVKYIEYKNAEYIYPYYYSEGLATVYIDGKTGFIDKGGKVVIEPKYYDAFEFCEGMAAVSIVDDDYNISWGFIDKTGKLVVPCIYSDVSSFRDGLAMVRKDGRFGFIDKTGKVVIPIQYENTWDESFYFNNGLAVVPTGNFEDPDFAVIDKTGKTVFKIGYDFAANSFYDGMLAVGVGGEWHANKDADYRYYSGGKYGFIDANGREVVAPIYDYVYDFYDGIAVVWKDNKAGAIDKTGRVVIPIIYDIASDFGSDGLLCVCNEEGLWGYVDYTGKVVIDFKFDWCNDFHEGYVNNSINYKWGMIDTTGRTVIPFEYDMVFQSSEGLVLYRVDDAPYYGYSKYGYMDTMGRVIIDPVFDYAQGFTGGVALVEKGEKYGVISKTSIRYTAKPTASRVLVNGSPVSFDAYEINDNNYFKLRDLAYILSGTGKQFEVTWDEGNQAINLIPGKSYTAVGGEMATGKKDNATAHLSTATVYINGKEVHLTAYNINDNNYFKLRDLGKAFDFGVIWDGAANTIRIDTSIGYSD